MLETEADEGNGLKLDLRGGSSIPVPEETERVPSAGALGTGSCVDGDAFSGSDRIGAVLERAGGWIAVDREDGIGVLDCRDWEGPSFSATSADLGRNRWNSYFAEYYSQ